MMSCALYFESKCFYSSHLFKNLSGVQLNGVSANGRHLRSDSKEATQYLQKTSVDNSSKGRNLVGASHGNTDLKVLGTMYADTSLPQQKQQYPSSFLHNCYSLRDQYHSTHALGSAIILCQENKLANSWHSDNVAEGRVVPSLLDDLKNNPRSLDLLDVLNHVVEFRCA